ncbi:MAG: hypothetical protein JW801_14190 [Bacteroidales bacterium]|nr:hypothetical protein [Bacteroidales bacterium]
MKLRIPNDFKQAKLAIDQPQIDYDSLVTDQLILFIYGHPVDFPKRKWLNCNNLAEYYRSGKLDFIDGIDGVFTLIILDKQQGRLIVITDRLGIYTPFYHLEDEQLCISDRTEELKSELARPEIDKDTVLELLNLGLKIGNKTLYRGIREFEPARIYEFGKDFSMKEKEYWSVFDLQPSERMSKEDFKNLFNSNLDVITDLEDTILLPISGGKDTRMLLSAILHKKEKLHCYTFGPPYHSDIKGSVKICNRIGISHDIIEADMQFGREIDFNRDLKNMNLNGIGPYFFNLLVKKALIREKDKARLVLQGDLGNQMWRHHPFGRSVPQSMDPSENASWMLKNLTRVLYFKGDHSSNYANLYSHSSIQDVVTQLQESIRLDLMKLKDPEKPSDYSEFFILRTLAYNFYSNILKYIGRHFRLFVSPLQKDLLQQLHLLSIEERVRGGHIDYIIAENNKFLSTMPYYNSGRVMKYIKLISNSVSQKMIGTNLVNHPELHNYPLWIRKYHKDFFYRVLNPDKMVLGNYFNADELKNQVGAFLEEKYSILGKNRILLKYSNQHFVYNLFCLEQWLQFHEQKS